MANRLKKVFEAKLTDIFTNQEAANDNGESDSDDTIGTCSLLSMVQYCINQYSIDNTVWVSTYIYGPYGMG